MRDEIGEENEFIEKSVFAQITDGILDLFDDDPDSDDNINKLESIILINKYYSENFSQDGKIYKTIFSINDNYNLDYIPLGKFILL